MGKRFLVILWIAAAFVATSAEDDADDGTTSAPDTDPTDAGSTPTDTDPTGSTPTSAATDASTNPADTSSTDTTPAPTDATEPPNPCIPNPCKGGSTCEPRSDENFVCLCLPGETYDGTSCNKAKVFPGKLRLSDVKFDKDLADKQSTKFKTESDKITAELKKAFDSGGNMYTGAIVQEFQPAETRRWSTGDTKADPDAVALVDVNFAANSAITQKTFDTEIKKVVCDTCPLKGAFTSTTLCDSNSCDGSTASCQPTDGSFTCTCIDGYIKTDFSDRICLACPSGKKAQGESECVDCSFGYSGLNCKENWLLLLVIIASVLGGLLLITLIVLPVVALKSPKKSSKKLKGEDLAKPYISHSSVKPPVTNSSFPAPLRATVDAAANGASGNYGGPRLPRATSNSNNLEMTPSNSRQNLVPGRNSRLNDDNDDVFSYPQSRPQTNPYAQSRPQSNPYTQNRAQVNPYAERQGQTNPYYTNDDGRRY